MKTRSLWRSPGGQSYWLMKIEKLGAVELLEMRAADGQRPGVILMPSAQLDYWTKVD